MFDLISDIIGHELASSDSEVVIVSCCCLLISLFTVATIDLINRFVINILKIRK